MISQKELRSRLAVGTAIATVILVVSGDRNAQAGVCVPDEGSLISCVGPADIDNDQTQNLSGGDVPVTVTAEDGFGIDTSKTGGDALNILSNGNLTFNDTNAAGSDITGAEDGIDASNENFGTMTVISKGTVVGVSANGIRARNSVGADKLTISAATVSGGTDGMYVRNYGSGDLVITTTGDVTGDTGAGIDATNFNGGLLSITTSGMVSGGESYGIIAINDEGGTGVTISTEEVFGGNAGVAGLNRDIGDVTITTSGAITGSGIANNGTGFGIFGQTYGGVVSITAKETVTSEQGLAIGGNAFGSGGVTITAYDDVIGGFGGVFVSSDTDGDITITTMGTVTVDSDLAIRAQIRGPGSVSITAMDAVTNPDGVGIVGFVYTANGGSLTISATDVSASEYGISGKAFGQGDLSISATGAVTAGLKAGIFGRNYNGGAVSITSTGSVHSADANAVDIANDASGTDTTLWIIDASSDAANGVNVDHQGSGQLKVTIDGAVSGVIGINNVDATASGPIDPIDLIELTPNASVTTTTGQNAIVDGVGDTALLSQGSIVGDVIMGAGNDFSVLLSGTATGTFDMGAGDDEVAITGPNSGGMWNDADLDGVFDNNEGLPLTFVGGDDDGPNGGDRFTLDGVTAEHGILDGVSGFETLFLVNGSLLVANDADLTGFDVKQIDATSTLQAEGNSPSDTITGSLISFGLKDIADGATNDRLTIGGDFVGGFGSILHMDIDLEHGEADEFIILGGVRGIVVDGVEAAHEQTAILLEVRGTPVPARQDDLGPIVPLVDVSATGETEPGDFALPDGPLHFGGFAEYDLDLAPDGIWYLAPDFLSQAYVYESLPGALQTIGAALNGQLVERVGVRDTADVASGVWGRAVGLSLDSEGDLDSTTGGSFEQTIGFLQGGGEVVVSEGTSGRLLIGGLAHWGTSSLDVSGADGGARGSADVDFYGGGLTATWYGAGGLYLDGVVQYTAYDVDIASATRPASAETDGYGVSVSGEAGYRIPLGGAAFLVPQAQLVWQTVDFDDFTDTDGARIGLGDGDSLVGRLGVAFENSAAIGSAQVTGYVEANLLHEFLGDNAVTATSLGEPFTLTQDLGGTSVEVGFGTTVAVSRGVSFFGEVDYTIPFDNGVQGFQAVAGLRWSFGAPPPPPPAPVVAPVAETAFIVFFDWDRADLTPEANLVLDDVVVVANQSGYASIRLDGYTDLSGSAAYNLGLSERRANSVADGLIARGIAPDEIVIRAFGEENPLVPTPDGVREPQNRRVEIFLS